MIQAIVGMWRKVGIEAEIEIYEIAKHYELRAADTAGAGRLLQLGQCDRRSDHVDRLCHVRPLAAFGVGRRGLDRHDRAAVGREGRGQAHRRRKAVDKYIAENGYVIPLIQYVQPIIYSDKVKVVPGCLRRGIAVAHDAGLRLGTSSSPPAGEEGTHVAQAIWRDEGVRSGVKGSESSSGAFAATNARSASAGPACSRSGFAAFAAQIASLERFAGYAVAARPLTSPIAAQWAPFLSGKRERKPMTLRAVFIRIATTLITLLGVAVIVFVTIRLAPGDPIAMMLPPGASQEDMDRLRALYGLDKSIPEQFFIWLGQVLHGDFGTSISLRENVMKVILGRLGDARALPTRPPHRTFGWGHIGGRRDALSRNGSGNRHRCRQWHRVVGSRFSLGPHLHPRFRRGYSALCHSGRVTPTLDFLHHRLLSPREHRAPALRSPAISCNHMLMPALALALPLSAVIAHVLKTSLKEVMLQDYAVLGCRPAAFPTLMSSCARRSRIGRNPRAYAGRRAVHLPDWRHGDRRALVLL